MLVVAADRARLRRMASAVPLLGQCKVVACWLTDAPTPWVLVPRPEWPRTRPPAAREADDRGVLTVAPLRLRRPRAARRDGDGPPGRRPRRHHPRRPRRVVRRSSRRARSRRPQRAAARRLGRRRRRARRAARRGRRPPRTGDVAEHHVIDRAPTVVTDPGPEPVDEQVFNPIGFRKDWDHPVVDLARPVGPRPGHRGRRRGGPRVQGVRLPTDTADRRPARAGDRRRAGVVTGGVTRRGAAARRRARRRRSTSTTRCAARSTASPCVAPPSTTTRPWPGARRWPRAPACATWAAGGQRPAGDQAPEMLDFAMRQVARQRGAERRAGPGRARLGRPTATPYAARSATVRTRC